MKDYNDKTNNSLNQSAQNTLIEPLKLQETENRPKIQPKIDLKPPITNSKIPPPEIPAMNNPNFGLQPETLHDTQKSRVDEKEDYHQKYDKM